MKQLLIFIFILVSTACSYAQLGLFSCSQEKALTIDTARYKVTYRLNYSCHSKADVRFKDVRILLIGREYVKDFSDIINHYDSLMTADARRGADTFRNPNGYPWPYEILRCNRKKSADIKYRLPVSTDMLHFTDTIPDMKWEIYSDTTRNILGYECHKASIIFSGRKYYAWYAPDLPLPFGPYKFGGLPGLIMQIQDDANQFIWEIEGFEKSSDPIQVYDYGGEKKCSLQDASKTIARCYKTPLAFQIAASGGCKVYIVGKDGKIRDASEIEDTPIPYEPIELK